MFKNNDMKFKGKATPTKQGFLLPKEINEICLLLRFVDKDLICLFVMNIVKLYC